MGWLQINTDGGKTAYLPGEAVSGSVRWQFEQRVDRMELRLFWYTRGKGTRDVGIAASQTIEAPQPEGNQSFSLALPEAPYSFSGRLISLLWSLELVIQPGGEAQATEIVMSPTGSEILLPEGPPDKP